MCTTLPLRNAPSSSDVIAPDASSVLRPIEVVRPSTTSRGANRVSFVITLTTPAIASGP